MKASVLIANYNGEKYIEDCINSLLNQTYKNFEIIFFDDNSKDRSLEIIKKFENINIIENKLHSTNGSYNQMNAYQKAFEKSSGEIILTLDSDDYYHPKKIEIVVERLKNNYEIFFDLPILVEGSKKTYIKKRTRYFGLNFFPFITQQSCLSAKREIFEDLLNKVNFKSFPDVWFDFRAGIYSKYKFSNVVIINDNLTFYRPTQTGISSKFKHLSRSWWKRRLEYHEYVKRYLKENNYSYNFNFDLLITKIVNKVAK